MLNFVRKIPGWLWSGVVASVGAFVLLWRSYVAGRARQRDADAAAQAAARDAALRKLHEQEVKADTRRRETAREAKRQIVEVDRRTDEALSSPPKTESEADAEARRLLEDARRRARR